MRKISFIIVEFLVSILEARSFKLLNEEVARNKAVLIS